MHLDIPATAMITEQGSSDEGHMPSASEIPLAGAVFVMREAIYTLPNGCTKSEYCQWVEKMHWVMVSRDFLSHH